MKKTLMMVFRTNQNQKVTVSLPDPREDITRAEVVTVMQMIIDKTVLISKKGTLAEIEDAIIKSVEETPVA